MDYVFALASSPPLKPWHQRPSLKIRPNLQFKGWNFIKLDVKGWRGGEKKKTGATALVEIYTVQYIRLQWLLCTTADRSHKFTAAAVLLPTLDSPGVELREQLDTKPTLPTKTRAHIHPACTDGYPQR